MDDMSLRRIFLVAPPSFSHREIALAGTLGLFRGVALLALGSFRHRS
jgi:hypothetical protein